MSFDKQVSETCKTCFFHIRVLRNIRASLTTEASFSSKINHSCTVVQQL